MAGLLVFLRPLAPTLTLSVGWNAEDFLATVPTDLLQRIANVYALDLVMDFESVEGQVSRPQP